MMTKISADRAYVFAPALHVVLRAELKGEVNVIALKKAITYAVSKYEILNCRILQDNEGSFYYVSKENRTIPNIEVRDYQQDSQEFINEQERIEFDLEKGELIRFVISSTEDKMVLNIVEHHIAGDGKSLLIFLQDVMMFLQDVIDNKDVEVRKEDVVPVNVRTLAEMSKHVTLNPLYKMSAEDLSKKWEEDFDGMYTHQDLHKLFEEYWMKHKTRVSTAVFEEEDVRLFASKCKEQGVTVNSGLITSISKTLKTKSKICVAVDTRMEDQQGMGNYASSIIIEPLYDENRSFWDNAREIQQLVTSQTEDRKQLFIGLLFIGEFADSLIDASYFQSVSDVHNKYVDEYNDLTGIGADGIPLLISNLGRVPIQQEYKDFNLEELSFFSPLCPGYHSNMGVATANGKMVMNMQYNENGIDYNEIMRDLENLVSVTSEKEKELIYQYA